MQKWRSTFYVLFANISKIEIDQWLKFEYIAVLGMLNNANSLDHKLVAEKLKKQKTREMDSGKVTLKLL